MAKRQGVQLVRIHLLALRTIGTSFKYLGKDRRRGPEFRVPICIAPVSQGKKDQKNVSAVQIEPLAHRLVTLPAGLGIAQRKLLAGEGKRKSVIHPSP